MSSGSSSPARYSTTTSSSAPWAEQQPYLTEGFQQAKDNVLNAPRTYYPNSTVVPMSNQTNTALGLQEARALEGSPLVDAAQTMVQNTASGDYLADGNPYLQSAIQNATQPIMEQFNEDIMPKIQSGFSDAGRYGSGLQARAQERAGQTALDQASKIASNMAYQNYSDERGNQLNAAQLAPGLAAQDYSDIGQLADVGATREGEAGAILQEDIDRFNFGQTSVQDAITQYMALVGGGSYGGQTTGTQPIYSNKASDAMGLAATAAGIGGTLFGKKSGIW